jgi:DNA adenine methylase
MAEAKTGGLTPPLKWWGGKHYLAKKIIALMPKHLHYVEPYFGGGAVLLERDPLDPSKYWSELSWEKGVSEVVNDINGELMNFWRVLQDEASFASFRRIVGATPFSQVEWEDAAERRTPTGSLDVRAAVAFFIRCRQSRAGDFKCFATLTRNRTRRMQNEQASAWWNCVEGLPAVHARLKRVLILNDDALKVIEAQDGEKTLFYLDPPYVHEARSSTGNYQHEMTEEDHVRMLETIRRCQGMVMLSGYPNPLYERTLGDWSRHDFKIDNKAAGGKTKAVMTEVVWTNF